MLVFDFRPFSELYPLPELDLLFSLLSLSLCWCWSVNKVNYSLQTSLLSEDVSTNSESVLIWFWELYKKRLIKRFSLVKVIVSLILLSCFNFSRISKTMNSVKKYILFSRAGLLKSDGTGAFYKLHIQQFCHELNLTFYLILGVFFNRRIFCFL